MRLQDERAILGLMVIVLISFSIYFAEIVQGAGAAKTITEVYIQPNKILKTLDQPLEIMETVPRLYWLEDEYPNFAMASKETNIDWPAILMFYQIGQEKGIHWQTLLSIYLQETDKGKFLGEHNPQNVCSQKQWSYFLDICQKLGRDPLIQVSSSAGAIGPMQFMPKTWDEFGQDYDQNGVADPWSLPDAISGTANFLIRFGYTKTAWKAICMYNGGSKNRKFPVQHYTAKVLYRAHRWGAKLNLDT